MGTVLHLILAISVFVPAIAGLIRFRQISPVYFPFLIIMWLGAFNETLSQVIIYFGYYNIYNFNLYQIIEAFLILWFFYTVQLFPNRLTYNIIAFSFVVAYLIDNIFFSGFHYFNSHFRIFYSVVVVLMSIHLINQLLISERSNLLKHPVFLICAAFLLFFTLTIITEVFWVYGKHLSKVFRLGMQDIFAWSNGICNIIYAIAILWMPRRHSFSLPY